jgi:hypothetical protein
MRLHFVTKPRRQDKAPKFVLAHLVLACASLAFGALAVGGWFLAYYETSSGWPASCPPCRWFPHWSSP